LQRLLHWGQLRRCLLLHIRPRRLHLLHLHRLRLLLLHLLHLRLLLQLHLLLLVLLHHLLLGLRADSLRSACFEHSCLKFALCPLLLCTLLFVLHLVRRHTSLRGGWRSRESERGVVLHVHHAARSLSLGSSVLVY